MNYLLKLQNTGKTVFLKQDIENILNFSSKKALDMFLYRIKKSGYLKNIRRGIYVFENYNLLELGSKLRKKSYVSLETVLQKQGIVFQHYDTIFCVSDDRRDIVLWGQKYSYLKLRDDILLNPLGVEYRDNYMIASAERAICDRLYFSKNYYFDNVEDVDFDKLRAISKIYNMRVQKEVISLQKRYEAQYSSA